MTPQERRKLDAWIAEHVMGWKRTENPDGLTDTGEVLLWHRPEEQYKKEVVLVGEAYKPYGGNRFARSWKEFSPTTDPVAAMLVLEKCIQHSKKSICQCICPEGYEVYLGGGDYAKSTVRGDSLPLAICKFAQKLFSK